MHYKRGAPLKIAITLFSLFAIIHVATHITIFETNLSFIKTIRISGLVVGDTNLDNIETNIKKSEKIQLPSLIIIGAEWILVFSLIALSLVKKHVIETTQKAMNIELINKKNRSETDLDILYEMLKKNKRIRISRLAELFKVDKKIIEEWGKILEESGYVIVDYPRFGEIEIVLKDEETQKA